MLEDEFRQLALDLPEERCRTSHYLELIRHLDESDEPQLLDYLRTRRQQLQGSIEHYRSSHILEQEVTAETVAAHRLLEEGMQGWLDGIEELLTAVEAQADCEQALDRIEYSNRLLVSVQSLHRRVLAQTSAPKRASY